MQIVTPESPNVGTIGKGYPKVRSTEPKLAHPSNPSLMRQLTKVEHARVKGVFEGLIAGMSSTMAHELLGQSVIGPKLKAVGKLIVRMCRNWVEGIHPVYADNTVTIKTASKNNTDLCQLDLFAAC